MKKLRKKLSGMTLVEILVALAVFALLSLVLVTMGNAVERNTRAANNLNSRVAVEGPIAEAQDTDNALLVNNNFSIIVAQGIEQKDDEGNVVGTVTTNAVYIEGTLCYVNDEFKSEGVTNGVDADGKIIPNATVDSWINDYRTNKDNGDYIDRQKFDDTFKFVRITKPTQTLATTTTTESGG